MRDLAPLWVDKMAAHVGAGHPQAEMSLDVIDIYRAQAVVWNKKNRFSQ